MEYDALYVAGPDSRPDVITVAQACVSVSIITPYRFGKRHFHKTVRFPNGGNREIQSKLVRRPREYQSDLAIFLFFQSRSVLF